MDFVLGSGAKLTVSMAAWQDMQALRKATTRCFLNAGMSASTKVDEVQTQMLLVDDDVERAVFQCAKSAIYEGAKVDAALFDDQKLKEKAVSDYFEIVAKVIKVNTDPFFRHASSASPAANGAGERSQA